MSPESAAVRIAAGADWAVRQKNNAPGLPGLAMN